jgi:hypothetical protein
MLLRQGELRKMGKQGKVIDAPGLVFVYTPPDRKKNDENSAARFAEAAVRILGGLLLLYKHHVPVSYYEAHHTS